MTPPKYTPLCAPRLPDGFTCYASSPKLGQIGDYIAVFYGGERKTLAPIDGLPGYFSVTTLSGRLLSPVVIRTASGYYFGTRAGEKTNP